MSGVERLQELTHGETNACRNLDGLGGTRRFRPCSREEPGAVGGAKQVPDAAAQAEAMKLVKEVYGDAYAHAKTNDQKQALAKKLLEKAGRADSEPTGEYVLLRLARDIATQAADVETAFAAVDAMARSFKIDPVEVKAGVLTAVSKKARRRRSTVPL